ncbi:unnamed protein product [Gongylonema pulchrum]|uniref:Secreted protein n=1 Tax=Gongylonema pulchrum TaxID=637853 RepID=A0A183EAZ1_9BILA|nr:unnamed protein product [Gongylonema pulchrum]
MWTATTVAVIIVNCCTALRQGRSIGTVDVGAAKAGSDGPCSGDRSISSTRDGQQLRRRSDHYTQTLGH